MICATYVKMKGIQFSICFSKCFHVAPFKIHFLDRWSQITAENIQSPVSTPSYYGPTSFTQTPSSPKLSFVCSKILHLQAKLDD